VETESRAAARDAQDSEPIFRNTPPGPNEPDRARWQSGGGVMQGFLGVYALETIYRSGGEQPPVDGSGEDLSHLPVLGGGGQLKLAGERVDFGVEAMMSFAWRVSAAAVATGENGAIVAVDVNLLVLEFYGGPFVSAFLGERWRVYGGAGPMMEWAWYDQEGEDESYDSDSSGFGTGWYARTGLEFAIRPGLMVGAGVRWSDSVIDLDSGLGDLDLEGIQWAFTVTTGI
jgi:opacity protein-like surface antigen